MSFLNNLISIKMEVILTGARPTGQLHIGNYLGAIKPIIELSSQYSDVRLFTATLHSFTDQDPRITIGFVNDLVKDYIAAGVDPNKVVIFDQMAISREIAMTTLYLSKLVTVNRLTNIPTLKEKLKNNSETGSANGLLLQYPLMMAADILLQQTNFVPVGLDQQSHIEFTRDLVEKFSSNYHIDSVFCMPKGLIQEELNIMSLDGDGKMSKTKPKTALFLGDDDIVISKKIKAAKTGQAGEASDSFNSLFLIGEQLSSIDQKRELNRLKLNHFDGKPVMGEFKNLLTEIVISFVSSFREKRNMVSDKDIEFILSAGAEKARESANFTLEAIELAMIGKSFSFR
jgi:tryptophanyl-tRNA synthetase